MVVPFQTVMIPLNVTASNPNLKNVRDYSDLIDLGCPLAVFMYHGFIKSIPVQIEGIGRDQTALPLITTSFV